MRSVEKFMIPWCWCLRLESTNAFSLILIFYFFHLIKFSNIVETTYTKTENSIRKILKYVLTGNCVTQIEQQTPHLCSKLRQLNSICGCANISSLIYFAFQYVNVMLTITLLLTPLHLVFLHLIFSIFMYVHMKERRDFIACLCFRENLLRTNRKMKVCLVCEHTKLFPNSYM